MVKFRPVVQGFSEEIETLQEILLRRALILARVDGVAAGCVALKAIFSRIRNERLFVRPYGAWALVNNCSEDY